MRFLLRGFCCCLRSLRCVELLELSRCTPAARCGFFPEDWPSAKLNFGITHTVCEENSAFEPTKVCEQRTLRVRVGIFFWISDTDTEDIFYTCEFFGFLERLRCCGDDFVVCLNRSVKGHHNVGCRCFVKYFAELQ